MLISSFLFISFSFLFLRNKIKVRITKTKADLSLALCFWAQLQYPKGVACMTIKALGLRVILLCRGKVKGLGS